MKKENREIFFSVLVCVAAYAIIFSGGYAAGARDRHLALEESSINMTGRTGVYFINSEVYCVKTKGRTLEEIKNTDYHEMCHHLVKKDWEHFCTDKDVKR